MKQTERRCRFCDVVLTDENWCSSQRKICNYICKECNNKQRCVWAKNNPDKARAIWTRSNRKRGRRSFTENKECAQYLGVYVAERVLRYRFNDVEVMPMNNSGYDFICNHGKKIDVKSSCRRKDGQWMFTINHNTIADYFLCLAFDNRKDLNPLHIWLLPGNIINHLTGASIGQCTIDKWSMYKLDVEKVSTCCDNMRH